MKQFYNNNDNYEGRKGSPVRVLASGDVTDIFISETASFNEQITHTYLCIQCFEAKEIDRFDINHRESIVRHTTAERCIECINRGHKYVPGNERWTGTRLKLASDGDAERLVPKIKRRIQGDMGQSFRDKCQRIR